MYIYIYIIARSSFTKLKVAAKNGSGSRLIELRHDFVHLLVISQTMPSTDQFDSIIRWYLRFWLFIVMDMIYHHISPFLAGYMKQRAWFRQI